MENTQTICSKECRQHIFSIKGLKDKQFNCSILLCPRLCLDSKKYHNFPVFNHDQKQYTSAFINGIDSQILLEFQKEQISQFNEKCEKAHIEKEELEFPKPPSKKNYCFICQCNFQCYFQHILSEEHKERQKQNHSSNLISDTCLNFGKQGVINAPPPFQVLQNCSKGVENSSSSDKSCVKQNMEQSDKSSSSHGPLSEQEREASKQSVELHEKEQEQSSDQVIITEVRPAKHPSKHKLKEQKSESEQISHKKKKDKGKKIKKNKKKSSKSKSKSKKDKKSKKKSKKKKMKKTMKKMVKQEQVYSQSEDKQENEDKRSNNILQHHQHPQVKLIEEQRSDSEENDVVIQKVQKSRAVLDQATQKIVQGLVQEVKNGIFDPPRKYRKASDFQCRRMDYDPVAIDKNAETEEKQDNYYYYYDKNQNLKMKAKNSDNNTILNASQGQSIVNQSIKNNSGDIIQIDKEGYNNQQQLSETVSANSSKKIVPSHVLEFKKKFPYEYNQKSTESILKSSIEDSLVMKRQSQGHYEDQLKKQKPKSSKSKYSNPHMPRMMPGPNDTHIQKIIQIDLDQNDNNK